MHFPQKFPILKVGKYLLREAKKSDAKFYFQCLTDPETIRFTSYGVKDILGVEQWFQDYKKQFRESKRISWVIEEIETGDFLGEMSLFDVSVEHNKGEIGFFLGKKYWNRGIMSEVSKAVLDYAFGTLQMHRLQSIAMGKNMGSRRLLEKNKFREEGILRQYKLCRGKYCDFILYSRIAAK
ncbi:MAG: GNAT family N-acetyltransferase [Patescibacteria group bacterium]